MMKLLPLFTALHILKTGKMTGSQSDDFGSCNYTDFVADAVGNCEKNFYISLALDQKADCRQVTSLKMKAFESY